MTVTDLSVTTLSPALGAEISGIDLRDDLPQAVVDEILALWHAHIVLVFRGQDLTMEQQLHFAARFGELGERKQAPDGLRERTEGIYQTNENTLLVTNIKVDGQPLGAFGDADMWFHIDSGYAYEALSDEMKKKLSGRKALHIHEYLRTEKVDIT